MHFDLTDLRLYVLVAEEGNLTRAANRRNLSLAAASARIKALESHAGMPLFYREARGVSLTSPGEAFLRHAQGILRQTEQLNVDLRDYGAGLRGTLRVFANTTAVNDFLPEILPGFLAANVGVNIDLQEKPNLEIARCVLDGRGDIGIVAGSVDALGLRAIHFSTDQLVLVVPKGHALSSRKSVAFADVLGEDAVGMVSGSTLERFLTGKVAELGKVFKVRIQLASFDAMCRMISAGVGVGVVPESAARRSMETMDLSRVELTDPWRVRERFILVRQGVALPAYAQSLIEAVLAYHLK